MAASHSSKSTRAAALKLRSDKKRRDAIRDLFELLPAGQQNLRGGLAERLEIVAKYHMSVSLYRPLT